MMFSELFYSLFIQLLGYLLNLFLAQLTGA
jgi:hypothetical protein